MVYWYRGMTLASQEANPQFITKHGGINKYCFVHYLLTSCAHLILKCNKSSHPDPEVNHKNVIMRTDGNKGTCFFKTSSPVLFLFECALRRDPQAMYVWSAHLLLLLYCFSKLVNINISLIQILLKITNLVC